ncbi:UvrD-helicase domain-containing protein [Mycobacterium sp.]|uniref:UvrD-helicase domain-containing protein n=1 Tax=Mycobacterium sp. TaxID=1785 RepID=UPI0025FC9507|nr:UvrD-helicase domain-containing protein [Mycobacterium sp.]
MYSVRDILSFISQALGLQEPEMSAENVNLNDEQLEVVKAPAVARLLVIAGAGQGKTEVVVSRIDNLVQDEGLDAEEILVLSFSRAAVSAVRTRLDLRDVAAANVRTFDSFASFLLFEAGIQLDGNFEARIRRATRSLREAEKAPQVISSIRHVVIDEVQDLVGDRADFVIGILELLDKEAGITALGDPLQGVYDFQLEDSLSTTSSVDVFGSLTKRFGCEAVGLGQNYRARGKFPKEVVRLGDAIRDSDDGDTAEELLDDLVLDLPDRGDIDAWYDLLTPRSGKTTAVLCTTNADVLRVSRYLNEQGVAHAVRRQAQDFGAAKWIASALGPLPGPKERRSEVEAALERLLEKKEVAQRWTELKAAEGRRSEFDSLNLLTVARLVKARALPLTLTEPDHSSVIVSTIHRAKGLEFDSVFVVEPTWVPDHENSWTRVRRQYVALSRARDDIFVCRLPQPKSFIKADPRLWGRFKEEAWSKKRRGVKWTKAFEFNYNDVESAYPTASTQVTAEMVQKTLASDDLVGMAIQAELDEEESTEDSPSYLLVTETGHIVGRTSGTFDDTFAKAFGWLGSWPGIVDGLSLVSVETVAGEPNESEKAGLGSSGFWLVPRVTGLARPDLSTT